MTAFLLPKKSSHLLKKSSHYTKKSSHHTQTDILLVYKNILIKKEKKKKKLLLQNTKHLYKYTHFFT